MDRIFLNGRINTLDRNNTTADAVWVSNGFIKTLGREADVRKSAGAGAEIVDLKGAVMFPGFIEAHNHLPMFGYMNQGLDLSPQKVKKMDDVLGLIKSAVASTPPGEWIRGARYAEYFLEENRHPTRKDLDPVSPDHPVILYHTSFHAAAMNSKALEAVNITRDTPDPQGGRIDQDPDTGEPNGVVHDQVLMDLFNVLFFSSLGRMSREERVDLLGSTTEIFARHGLVLAADALVMPQTLSMYQETLAAGRLKTRIYTMNLAAAAGPLIDAGLRTGFGSPWLRIGPIKLFHDGGMSNRTAAVREPFLTPPFNHGLKMQSREELVEIVQKHHDLGFQIAIHAQGDEALADVLDAFEHVLGPVSNNPLRHHVEHAGCLFPDLLKRAVAMNVAATVQPVFLSELGDGVFEAFGPERANAMMPFKSMLEAGLVLGGSSDSPVAALDPRLGIRDAVLRRTGSGRPIGPDQALTVGQALRMYTRGSAWLTFDEHAAGSIEPGKRADFTIMAADPREVAPEEIPDIPFVMTVVDGDIVYAA